MVGGCRDAGFRNVKRFVRMRSVVALFLGDRCSIGALELDSGILGGRYFRPGGSGKADFVALAYEMDPFVGPFQLR